MVIAVSVNNDEISPVFDWSKYVLLIECRKNIKKSTKLVCIDNVASMDRPNYLMTNKVNTLICGGISKELAYKIISSGINLLSFIEGNYESVINAFLKRKLNYEEYGMPGFEVHCRK